MISLKESTIKQEGSLHVSKLLKLNVLLETDELENLMATLEKKFSSLYFFRVQGIYSKGSAYQSRKEFIDKYCAFIEEIKQNNFSNLKSYQNDFALFGSTSLDALYSISVKEKQEMIRANKPVITIQMGKVQFSPEDGQFRAQIFSEDSIYWGLYFSYPQLFQDPFTKEVIATKDDLERFPNTPLFREIQLWVRHHTVPTPFIVNDKQLNSPIRIGKQCLSWINNHPQLVSKQIKVKVNAFT